MKTNFFESIAGLNIFGDCRIAIQQQKEGIFLVSVLIVNTTIKDDTVKTIPPMVFKGTAKELDAGLFEALQKPVQKTNELLTNMQQYFDQLEQTKSNSKMEQENQLKEKKTLSEKDKKYEAKMKKVEELEEKEKYGEAIGQLPKAADYPEHAEDIEIRLAELREKHGELTLL